MLKPIFLGGLLLAACPLAAVRSGRMALPQASTAHQPLSQKDTTLIVSYAAIGCSCAQWITHLQVKEPYKRRHIYLEPATAQLPKAEGFWDGEHLPLRLQVTGHYVSQSGYPKGYSFQKGKPEPAPVFQYRSIKVLPTKRTR
jgi:hypothetical protein